MNLLWLYEFPGFAVGLLLGSFLNVCIVRVPRGESIVRPGSRCVACGKPVRWFDNVPVLSWILLRGRCRDCGVGIGWMYPAVELACGLWFLRLGCVLWARFDPYASARRYHAYPAHWTILSVLGEAVLGWLLIGLIVIDWRWQRLPDAFTLTGTAIGLFLVCLQAVLLEPGQAQIVLNSAKQLRLSSPGSFAARGNVFLTGPEALIFGRLAAVVGAALILLLIRWGYQALRGREGLGLGDVKMLAMVAAFLGFWPAVLTLFLGVTLATMYALVLIVRRQAGALTRLPLGSFLGVGGLVTVLFGAQILGWYGSLLL